jgi:hypothetical protein
MHYGEGKFGKEQVIVQLSSGKQALSSIFQNVIDMCRLALGPKPVIEATPSKET